MDKMKMIEAANIKKEMPKFNVGDTVKIMVRMVESDDKVRLHPFEGVVIAKSGTGSNVNFTVRKVASGEGVERIFPLYSPTIEKIDVLRSGKVRRAKLYYLRNKIGKRATKIEEKVEKPQKVA